MKNTVKKAVACMAAIIMALCAVPVGNLAGIDLSLTASAAEVSSGQCGDNVYWTLDENGTLTISGEGEMWNYQYSYPYGSPDNSPLAKNDQIKTVIIENGVTSIGGGMFHRCGELTDVSIPNSVVNICEGAFYMCSGLTNITIPDSVILIGDDAFNYCRNITDIIIPDSVTTIGEWAFCNCSNLANLSLPNSDVTVDYEAFKNCVSLTSITIPGSAYIYGGAFSGCSSLTDVSIETGIKEISSSAFDSTPLYENEDNWINGAFYIDNCLIYVKEDFSGILEINDNTKYISYNILDSLNLNAIKISENNQYYLIEDGVLFYKGKTVLVKYPTFDKRTEYTIPDSVTEIAIRAFDGAGWLEYISIPYGVKSIGDYAFEGCVSLKNINIPNSIEKMGGYVFAYCWSLKEIIFSDNITNLPEGTLWNCNTLEKAKLPKNLTAIGQYAIYGTYCLKSITIPATVDIVENGSFYGCSMLNDIYIEGKDTVIAEDDFASGSVSDEFADKWVKCWRDYSSAHVAHEKHEITDDEYREQRSALEKLLEELEFEFGDNVTNNRVIHCYKDSKAAEYAIEHGITVLYFEDEQTHEHSYTSAVTTPATCTETGVMTYTCACGDSYTEAIKTTEHTKVTVPGTPATCKNSGLTDGIKCSVCGKKIEAQAEIPKLAHTEQIISGKAATCTETGLTDGIKCSVCGEILEAQKEIPAKSHAEADKDGKCPDCGEQIEVAQKSFLDKIKDFFESIILFFKKLFGVNN